MSHYIYTNRTEYVLRTCFFFVITQWGARARWSRWNWMSLAPHCARHSANILYIVCNFFFLFSLFLFRYGRFGRVKLLTPTSLAVYRVGRDDKGMYQCSVTNKRSSAQAMAELKLGGKLLCSTVASRYPIYAWARRCTCSLSKSWCIRVLRAHSFSIYFFLFVAVVAVVVILALTASTALSTAEETRLWPNLYNPSTTSYVGSGYTACGSKVPILCLINFTISLPSSLHFYPFFASWTDAAYFTHIYCCRCVSDCIHHEWCGFGRWTIGPRK